MCGKELWEINLWENEETFENELWDNQLLQNELWESDLWENERWENELWKNEQWESELWENEQWVLIMAPRPVFIKRRARCHRREAAAESDPTIHLHHHPGPSSQHAQQPNFIFTPSAASS